MKFKLGDLVQLHDKHREHIIGIVSEICPNLGWEVTSNDLVELNEDQYSCKIIPVGEKETIHVRARHLSIYKGE